jgi:hypothetical protein
VTLYRGQALVTRTVPLEGPKGASEVVVADIPEQVVADSLYAEGGEGVEVRAVRYRARAVGQEPREEVRKLDAAIEDINEKMQANKKNQEVLAKRAAYLDTSPRPPPRPTWRGASSMPSLCRSSPSSLSSSGTRGPRSS